MPKRLLEETKSALSKSSLETVVFCFGGVKGNRNFVTDVLIPSDNDYTKRGFGYVDVSQDFILKEFHKLEEQHKTLLATIHSHPLDELSLGDITTHMKVIQCYPHQLSGIFFNGEFRFFRIETIETPQRIVDFERFDRQIRVFGEEGQLALSETSVALIGVGGGNSKIAFELAGMGIGKLVLVDPDKWEESNRNRVLIPPNHVGMYKVESVKEIINTYYPEVKVEAHSVKAEDLSEEAYSKADFLVVGPDRWLTREHGNKIALKLKIPAVFPAAGIQEKDGKVHEMGGSVQVVVPDESPCFQCINNVDSLVAMKENLDPKTKEKLSKKYGVSLEVEVAPSIVSLNDVIAGLAILELVKLITGFDEPTYFQVFDALKNDLKPIKVSKNPQCPTCGTVQALDFEQVRKSTITEEEALSRFSKSEGLTDGRK
jgi:molybdopterin/thiamine biosynthesis adenylyltransferase